MALIVEDGSGVPGANSYVDRDFVMSFVAARGIDLDLGSPADPEKIDPMAISAMDYLATFRSRWKGEPVSEDQPLDWPRKCVVIGRHTFAANAIPIDIKSAQTWLIVYISRGIDLMPVGGTSAFVKREKVGPIETEYSETIARQTGLLPSMPQVDALLEPYLDGGFSLRTIRA